MNDKLREYVAQHKDSFDDQIPGPKVFQRVKEEVFPTRGKVGGVVFRILRLSVAAVLVFLAGLGALSVFNNSNNKEESSNRQSIVNGNRSVESPSVATPIEADLLQLKSDFTKRFEKSNAQNSRFKNEIVSRLVDQNSVAKRLTAASIVGALQSPDREVLNVLIKTMNSDPSSNVRIAAMEALENFSYLPFVRKELINSLALQKDPIVQISLIEILTHFQEQSILIELNKIINDVQAAESVKDQAYYTISKLAS